MKTLSRILLPMAVALAFPQAAGAGPLAVDGNVADWGIQVKDYVSGSDRTPSVFTTASVEPAAHLEAFFIEDTDDTAGDGGYVGPLYGGQNYDAEFMAAAFKGSRLHLLIVSGVRPDNGSQRYGPGDIRITGNNGRTWWIETGGGAGGGAGTPLTTGAGGSTYTLNSSGFTIGHGATTAAQTVGSIWTGAVTVVNDPIAPPEPAQFQIGAASVSSGVADYVFTRNQFTAQHSVIELSLDSGIFGDATHLGIYWGPSCNNDFVSVSFDGNYIPEPGSLPLLGLGIAEFALGRRRRKGQ